MASNPLSPLARLLGRQPWMMRTAPLVLPTERAIRTVTGGRYGILDIAGLPTLRMTVPGRKTGEPRQTSLLYVPHGADFLVIGSNWGNARHPVWSANLRAADTATVRVHGETLPGGRAGTRRRGARAGLAHGRRVLARVPHRGEARGRARIPDLPAASPLTHSPARSAERSATSTPSGIRTSSTSSGRSSNSSRSARHMVACISYSMVM